MQTGPDRTFHLSRPLAEILSGELASSEGELTSSLILQLPRCTYVGKHLLFRLF